MDLATRCGSGRVLNAPLLFGTSQGLLFIKKEMICLIFAFIDNIVFSITQPSNSVNMTLRVEKIENL